MPEIKSLSASWSYAAWVQLQLRQKACSDEPRSHGRIQHASRQISEGSSKETVTRHRKVCFLSISRCSLEGLRRLAILYYF